MNTRQQKGLQLAERGTIRSEGTHWIVPSQTRSSNYTVNVAGEAGQPPHCTCQDFELTGYKCKHIYAVEFTIQRQAQPDQPLPPTACKPKRPTYRQDWPAYNAAQTNEKAHFQHLLHALCDDVEEPVYAFGRPRLPLAEMVFSACFKVYSTVSCRRFMTDLAEACEKGYLSRVPHFNSIFNYLELTELTPILRSLIERSSLPLKAVEHTFTVDSSGFTTCRYVRWYDAKYGREMEEHEWIKAHLMCGVTTNIVTSVEITGGYGADSPQFRPLVESTARRFRMDEVSADKAYSSRENLERVDQHHGRAYIPFRSNSTGRALHDRKADLWDKLFHFYHLHRETFLEHYHRRSLVESTFWMIKSKFGEALRSKSDTAQVNELLCKVLCHNLCVLIQSMYELGIEPEFYGP
jgi:hypothetical protein